MGKVISQTLPSEMIQITEQGIKDGLYFKTQINQINPLGITPLYDEEMGLWEEIDHSHKWRFATAPTAEILTLNISVPITTTP